MASIVHLDKVQLSDYFEGLIVNLHTSIIFPRPGAKPMRKRTMKPIEMYGKIFMPTPCSISPIVMKEPNVLIAVTAMLPSKSGLRPALSTKGTYIWPVRGITFLYSVRNMRNKVKS